MTKDQVLLKYAELKKKEKELKDEIDFLKPEMETAMEGSDELELQGYGTFVRVSQRKWTYPKEIKSLKDRWEEAKKEAEQTGEAECVEGSYIKFNAEK